jgi:hypothetical protein
MEKGQACKVNVKRGRRDDGMRQHVAADHVRVQERLALFTRGGRITKQFRAWSGRTQGGQYLIEYLYRLQYSDYSDYRYQKKDAMRNSEEPANVSVCFRVMLVYVSFLFVL